MHQGEELRKRKDREREKRENEEEREEIFMDVIKPNVSYALNYTG